MVACETCTKTGMVMIFGEITTKAKFDYEAVVRKACQDIGYDDAEKGLDYRTMEVGFFGRRGWITGRWRWVFLGKGRRGEGAGLQDDGGGFFWGRDDVEKGLDYRTMEVGFLKKGAVRNHSPPKGRDAVWEFKGESGTRKSGTVRIIQETQEL